MVRLLGVLQDGLIVMSLKGWFDYQEYTAGSFGPRFFFIFPGL